MLYGGSFLAPRVLLGSDHVLDSSSTRRIIAE